MKTTEQTTYTVPTVGYQSDSGAPVVLDLDQVTSKALRSLSRNPEYKGSPTLKRARRAWKARE